MKKLGTSENKTIVLLSNTEFSGLAGVESSTVLDGAKISLAPIKAKLDLVDAKVEDLATLKAQCNTVIDKLNTIGV